MVTTKKKQQTHSAIHHGSHPQHQQQQQQHSSPTALKSPDKFPTQLHEGERVPEVVVAVQQGNRSERKQQHSTSPTTLKTPATPKAPVTLKTHTEFPTQPVEGSRIPDLIVAPGNENKPEQEKDKIMMTEFRWPHGGVNVFVTGDFDGWQGSVPMARMRDSIEFVAFIPLDRSQPHLYKFVVDGEWKYSGELPTEQDHEGNTNNMLPVRIHA